MHLTPFDYQFNRCRLALHNNSLQSCEAQPGWSPTMTAIVGHGVDIIDLKEFERHVETSGEHFVGRCFTEHERSYAGDGPNRIPRLAARFAAKEAVLKAIGTGWIKGISWKDVELVRDPSGAPSIRVSGAVARIADSRGISGFLVSLSHTGRMAMASVIAVGDAKPIEPRLSFMAR